MLISIIMPALNEESKIERALKSIRMQTINQDDIEILVIDGGSIDKTRDIASGYGAKVLDNPKVVMEEAKKTGLANCSGKYIILMDADEELTYIKQLENRLSLFDENPDVKALLINGYITPEDYPSLTRYVNSFGDPFSYFIYRSDSENLLKSFKNKYTKRVFDSGTVFYVNCNDIIPIGDGGTTMLDYEYYLNRFKDKLINDDHVSTLFSDVVTESGCFGVVNDDYIYHYTSVKFAKYLDKLRFRVIVNTYKDDHIPGVAARFKYSRKLSLRKYLFLLYCLLPPIVLLDSGQIAIRKKSFAFLLHFVFVYYVFFCIIYFNTLKILGIKAGKLNFGK